MSQRANPRKKLVEACATVALAVSQTESGAAHTVQLMLRNPTFREDAIRQALTRTADAVFGPRPSEHAVAARRDVKDACDDLRGYTGRVI